MNSLDKDMLSQEEIDALLRQNQDEKSSEDMDINQYLSPFDQDALGEIGNISFGSASTALSTLLGQKVEITTPTVTAVKRKDLANEFPIPHVAIHVQYVEGFKGIHLFIIKSKDAKIIANLMLGGTGDVGDDEELSEMDISAVQEAMNQMMGSAATSMSTIFNTTVNISPPGVDILNISEGQGEDSIPEDDLLIMVSFRLKIGDLIDSSIMQLTSQTFAKEMIEKLIGSGEEESKPATDTTFEEPTVAAAAETKDIHALKETVRNQPSYAAEQSNSKINANVNMQPAQFEDFDTSNRVKNQEPNLGILMDIPLQITVELGRTKRLIKDILELSQGSIIELDKLAGEPVDIFANNKLIAKGEVVVIDENFGVRVIDIISQYERVRKLQ